MTQQLEQLIAVARGERPADLLLTGGKVVNTLSGEILEQDVAICQDKIAGVGPGYEARETIDLEGAYLSPGFIDGHIHIESSMVEIPQFARAVVPLGTTTVIADPHEIANVLGYDGIRYMLESSKYNPLNVYFMLPSCVPATDMETAGSELRAFDLFPFLQEKWVLGLGEMMNYPGVLQRDPEVLDKLKISSDKRLDGHAPGLRGHDLCAYIAAGIHSDHESVSADEALEKIRLGMFIAVREGTAARNLEQLLPAVSPVNSRRFFFCSDDRHPTTLVEEGHVNAIIKKALRLGLDPVMTLRMATINSTEFYKLNHLGAVAPGRLADLVVFDDFEHLFIKMVFKSGQLVAKNQEPLFEISERPMKSHVRGSVNIKWLEGNEFTLPALSAHCRVIDLIPDQIITNEAILEPKIVGGKVESDPERDILKVAVIERHKASGNIGRGLVRGFGMKQGAMASSIGHDSHNIIAVGTNDADMMRAVIQINKMGGGIAIACDGEVRASLELPVAGLMSRLPVGEVSQRTKVIDAVAHDLGVKPRDPLMVLSFLALPVIPRLKLTDMGLVDVERFEFVDLFVDSN